MGSPTSTDRRAASHFFAPEDPYSPVSLGQLSSNQISAAIERSPAGILVADADLRILHLNRAAQPLFASLGDVRGWPWSEVLRRHWADDTADDVMTLARQTLTTGTPRSSLDFAAMRTDLQRVERYDWDIHRVGCADDQTLLVCYFAGPMASPP